jgi:hypothetical protein
MRMENMNNGNTCRMLLCADAMLLAVAGPVFFNKA